MTSVPSESSRALTCLHAPVFDIESSYLPEYTTECVDMTLWMEGDKHLFVHIHVTRHLEERANLEKQISMMINAVNPSRMKTGTQPILKNACDMDETRSQPMDFLKNETLLGNLGGWRFHNQAALGAQARRRKWSGVEELLEAV